MGLEGHPALISSPESTALKKEWGNPSGKRNKIVVAPLFTEGVKVGQITGKAVGKFNELGGVYAMHPYRITTTVTHTRAAAKGEQRFLTMFIPLGNRDKSPLKSIKQQGIDGATVELNDGRTVKISIVDGKLSAVL